LANPDYAREICIKALVNCTDDEVSQFAKFDYALRLFTNVSMYQDGQLSFAIGYFYYFRHFLPMTNVSESEMKKLFSARDDKGHHFEIAIYQEIAQLESLNQIDLNPEGDFLADSNLDLKDAHNFRYAKPLILSLISLNLGFKQLSYADAREWFFDYSASESPEPKLNRLMGSLYVHTNYWLVMYLLVTSTSQSSIWQFETDPKCQARNCGKWSHSASIVAYCPSCFATELICINSYDHLRFQAIAPAVTFSRSCNHVILDYRNISFRPLAWVI
jgi:hypothetical protein